MRTGSEIAPEVFILPPIKGSGPPRSSPLGRTRVGDAAMPCNSAAALFGELPDSAKASSRMLKSPKLKLLPHKPNRKLDCQAVLTTLVR